ncbi:MAG: cytochrome c maturation protein CcmE [Anaerolineales bacterium]|nr:cytochrome c maturation protein CcmE [Anaerolineales bacterium]
MGEEMDVKEIKNRGRIKFIIGGILIVTAVIYLIASSAKANTQYYLTVEETKMKYEQGELSDRNVRVSGAVIGESIAYDMENLTLTFTIAHLPGENAALNAEGGVAAALHQAVNDPDRETLDVMYEGPKPDLLVHEAQAIITGKMTLDGVFYADEVLLKCPSKYEEVSPEQSG